MKIAVVGYRGSGKSTLFEWLTGVEVDPALAHTLQSAMAQLADPRLDALCEIYHPKKVVRAALELIDTPGLSRDHQGNAAKLGLLRSADCLVLVIAGFDGSDPRRDLVSFEEDLLFADMEIVSGRIDRLRESLKKPRPTREQEQAELVALEPVLAGLESGKALRELQLSDEQSRAVRSFSLLTEKRKLIVINAADDEAEPDRFRSRLPEELTMRVVPAGLERELARLTEEERAEFEHEMGVAPSLKDELLRTMLVTSGQIIYFTAAEKEVRSWLLPQGATAVEAAATIHTDLARGFIRAETVSAEALIRAGSEREAKAAHDWRQETKDYVVADGDVLHIRFSV